MAEEAKALDQADLRAAVQAGLVTEAQAAGLLTLAAARAGKRAALPSEDEPFEFFRGFAEILVASGLAIFLVGIGLMLSVLGGLTLMIAIPAVIAALSWVLAGYFTLKRRMNLPSMVLVAAFGAGVYIPALYALAQFFDLRLAMTLAAIGTASAVALWFRRFRLPFAIFVLGLFALNATVLIFVAQRLPETSLEGINIWLPVLMFATDQLRLATLIFGLVAFAGAMWFDTRDRYRIGRHSATAFWLHLLAGATLVNSIAGSLYGGGANLLATAVALAAFALVALIVDRRSILTAGIAYIVALIYWAVAGDGRADLGDWATILILLGTLLTVLGTWWVQLRAVLMRALPDFPGKDRLPPYSETP